MKHPGRKLYHVTGGVGLLLLYYFLGRERALVCYGIFFLAMLCFDAVRLSVPAVNGFVFSRFKSLIRAKEEHSLTGTPYYILGAGLSLYLFSPEVATASICFLAFGDVAATTMGERYGKTRIGDKSLEGTAAFILAALGAGLLISFLGIHLVPWLLLLGALAAAGVELLPLRVNDNLTIPLISGGVMELALGIAR